MGAYAAWQLAMTKPDMFAALVPVCGGGMYWNAARLKNIPIRAFHGALDTTVLPEESVHMVAAVNNSGGKAELTVYPDIDVYKRQPHSRPLQALLLLLCQCLLTSLLQARVFCLT